jgi:hypothetical protein
MTLLVSDVAQDVFAYLGRPDQSALPLRDLIDAGSREVSSIIVDLFNTDRDYRASLVRLHPTGRDTNLAVDGEIVRLEGRAVGSSDDDWVKWERVPFASWDGDSYRTGTHYFSTYGGAHLVLSEDPSPYEFRALVESGSVRLNDLTDDTTLSALVKPLLFTRWALAAGAMTNDVSDRWEKLWARKERHLRLDLPRLEKEWRRYLEGGRGEGVSFKEPFNSRRDFDGCEMYVDGSGRARTT